MRRVNNTNLKLKIKLMQENMEYSDIANEMCIHKQTFANKITHNYYSTFTFCEKFYLAHRFGMRVEEIE
ncbi:MAG: hypothetical protein ACI4HZ_11040 [Ruminococcus sp.]